jgi:hypothetical protein
MLKPKITLLTRVKNTTSGPVCGIPAAGSRVIFADPIWCYDYRDTLASKLFDGSLEAHDIAGNMLTPSLAGGAALDLLADIDVFRSMLGFPAFPSYDLTVRLHWNLSAVHTIMDAIGADILSTDLAALGMVKEQILTALQKPIQLMSLGMFVEAAAATRLVPTDAFLTVARLELYASILESANAIV